MPQWKKKILWGKKGEIETVTDAPEGSDVKAPKLLELIEVSDPKVVKAGEIVQFLHDAKEDEGLFWPEDKILQRVTKASRAKKLKYVNNYSNNGELKVISIWGKKQSLSLVAYAQTWLLTLDGPC